MAFRQTLAVFVVLYGIVFMGCVQAGQPQVFGDYTVHYNAFNTDSLQPSMAEAYGIVRSKNRGMLTIAVIKKDISPIGKPVHAKVNITASNLTGQFREFKARELDEAGSIYYVSEFHVAHEEMLDFTLQILPEGETQVLTVKFRQQFFTQ